MFDSYGRNNGPFQTSSFGRQLPHCEIIKVNGQAGASSIQMAPNSSLFAADLTNPELIWLVQTDGAGYLSTTPLDVKPHQIQQENKNSLEERIKRLEDLYEQLLNSGVNKWPKKQRATEQQQQSTNTVD